jgi:hypothetical protein
VGLLALEDAETGELIELNTADATVRTRFHEQAAATVERLMADIRSEGVDTLALKTNTAYLPALQRFFKSRERRRL